MKISDLGTQLLQQTIGSTQMGTIAPSTAKRGISRSAQSTTKPIVGRSTAKKEDEHNHSKAGQQEQQSPLPLSTSKDHTHSQVKETITIDSTSTQEAPCKSTECNTTNSLRQQARNQQCPNMPMCTVNDDHHATIQH